MKIARRVALEIMEWTEKDGFWYRYGDPTGLKVATEPHHYPAAGYFRPDRSWFQMTLMAYRIFHVTRAIASFRFPSGHVEAVFNDGEIEAAHRTEREDIIVEQFKDKEAACEAALAFWDAFHKGTEMYDSSDPYAVDATKIFGITLAEVTPQLRSRAKTIRMGIEYGASPKKLMDSLNLTPEQVANISREFTETYPHLKGL